ncbi:MULTISPECIES: hypothetical protein [Nostoc]|uniref:Secreted protein n=1 Tax=Nostoc paludosum FACHB-159 TaxID=2692908 RepID=A0ABR8KH18_9NOSO|nr:MULTISPECIES: hypothetical protein [Nostoc]MBD2738844.1 hypothetical protein [Nostoc paludosum FACHB-159]
MLHPLASTAFVRAVIQVTEMAKMLNVALGKSLRCLATLIRLGISHLCTRYFYRKRLPGHHMRGWGRNRGKNSSHTPHAYPSPMASP